MAAAMTRPPSAQDVRAAQSHLVLLKSKMRRRGAAAPPPAQYAQADFSGHAPSAGTSSQPRGQGRFERVPQGDHRADADAGYASQAPMHGGPGRPREAARPQRGGVEASPRAAAVVWDPPEQDGRRAPDDGYPVRGGNGSRAQAASYQDAYQDEQAAFQSNPGGGFGGGQAFPGNNVNDGQPPEDDDNEPRVPCPDCGRCFKESVLEKHSKICKKVFMQKRKQFNSAANRLGEFEDAGQLIANAQKIDKEAHSEVKKPKEEKTEKVPAWKKKSLEFRAAMLAAKAATGDDEAQAKADEINAQLKKASPADEVPAGMVKCPHCGRTFNEAAGERHIAICQKAFGNKPGAGRLVKGGGRAGGAQAGGQPAAAPAPDPGRGAARMSSGAGAAGSGGAAVRRPSAHRSRAQGEPLPPGIRAPPGRPH